MEDNRIGDEEWLVARCDKRCREICKWIQHVSKNEKLDKDISKKVEVEWNTRETIDTSNGRLYHEVTISSMKRCDLSSMQ